MSAHALFLLEDGLLPRRLAMLAAGAKISTAQGINAFTLDPKCTRQCAIDDERWELSSYPAKRYPDQKLIHADSFVFHDTAGHTWDGMVRNANQRCRDGRCLGVTFTIDHDPQGTIRQHQALTRRSGHAGFMNDRSHGVEVINLFDPRKHKPNTARMEIIEARWFGGGRIICPTRDQMESGWRLIRFLSLLSKHEGGGLSLEFPCVLKRSDGLWYPFSQIPKAIQNSGKLDQTFGRYLNPPGVWAHGHLSNRRADGYLMCAYCLLRSRGFSPAKAYDQMKEMSKNTQRVEGRWHAKVPPSRVSIAAPLIAGTAAAFFWLRRA